MDAKEYGEKLTGYVAGGLLSMALSMGVDLGLFEVLKNAQHPLSLGELASSCDLKERYVEEWLGAMVSSQVLFVDEHDRYYIPEDCKAALPILGYTGALPLLGSMYAKVADCFRANGPPGFGWDTEDVPDQFKNWVDNRLKNADLIVAQILDEVKRIGGNTETCLEIGCGKGNMARGIHAALPKSKIIATDYNPAVVQGAIDKHKAANLGPNVEYQTQNVEKLPQEWTNKFDIVLLYDVLHDLPDPEKSALEVKRVLASNGIAIFVDPGIHSQMKENVGDIVAGMGYSISSFVCLPASLSSGGVGYGMGWGLEKKRDLLTKSGYTILSEVKLQNNVFAYTMFCKKN